MANKKSKSLPNGKGNRSTPIELGYALSSEEHNPNDLVRNARRAEQAGFTHIYIHQIGPAQDEFFEFYENAVLPRFQRAYV